MKKNIVLSALLFSSTLAFAFDFGSLVNESQKQLKNINQAPTTKETSKSSDMSSSLVSDGLKEALKIGVDYGVKELGKKDGYLSNKNVKIPLPKSLQKVEGLVRKAGGNKVADDLITSMNTAATKAAPKTTTIFLDAVENMSIEDAQMILAGGDDAATKYFEKKTSTSLSSAIKPIIQETMKENKVASYYETFNNYYKSYAKSYVESSAVMGYAKQFGVDSYVPLSEENLDAYVTKQAISGLYKMISKKESEIRNNPAAQTTSLLQKVFGE
jgi:hypothetical protein